MESEFLQETMDYVGFTLAHARALAAVRPRLESSFPAIVSRFYEAVLATPRALAVFVDGPRQIEHQKTLLTAWLAGVLSGKYDADYLALRVRIGRTHVRVKLEQRYAIGSMSLIREGLHTALRGCDPPPVELALTHDAIDKICDIELAIMVQAYAEDSDARLRDHERLATLGQLAGFIGHELRNPLAVMETSLHLLRKRLPSDDEAVSRHADRLTEQVRVSSGIINALVELARDSPIERMQVEMAPLVRDVLEALPAAPTTTLRVELDPALPGALLDRQAVRQLLLNLIRNAMEAVASTEGQREVVVRVDRDRDALRVTVDDSGPGIAEHLRPRLFEPLATTRTDGLGLGLALCRRIVEKHGGEIRAVHSALGGARLEVRLQGCFG